MAYYEDEGLDERGRARMPRPEQDRDVVLNFKQFCWVLDKTNGEIPLYRGSYKLSLANTQVLVYEEGGQFKEASKMTGIQNFIEARTGEYIILKNPVMGEHKTKMGQNMPVDLQMGKRVVIPGPQSFPIWAGQQAEVIAGHSLKSDEYLVVLVYDDVVEGKEEVKSTETDSRKAEKIIREMSLKGKPIGTQIIITGEQVRFYIPPTGVEVVKDESGNFIRKAVKLSEMEYCAIIDEKGQKHYHRGPGVIFPETPFERFYEENGNRIFQAYTLTKTSGLHLLVIKDFDRETGEKFLPKEFKWDSQKERFEAGEEIVIKGIECIFFPFDHIDIIGTIDALAISEGEGIYVREKDTGNIKLVKGPRMFLPDPRYETHVKRTMDEETCKLYRGDTVIVTNQLAQENIMQAQFLESNLASARAVQSQMQVREKRSSAPKQLVVAPSGKIAEPAKVAEGTAVSIYVPVGMAVMVVGMENGIIKRKVVMGPQRLILEYNENLEILTLSTGKPKTTDRLLKTCFLQRKGNKVSDIVYMETADHCPVKVTLSFRVSFEGDPEQWFNVSNYVKLLYDNLRSRMAGEAKKHGIEYFFKNYTDLIRDSVLGKKEAGKSRDGRTFEENGMRVYDVEILEFEIIDEELKELLIEAQQDGIRKAIENQQQKNNLESEKVKQEVTRQIHQEQYNTEKIKLELEILKAESQHQMERMREEHIKELNALRSERERLALLSRVGAEKEVAEVKNLMLLSEAQAMANKEKILHEEEVVYKNKLNELELKNIEAKVQAVVRQNASISPAFINALQTLGDKHMAAEFSRNFNLFAAMKGSNIAEVAGIFLSGLPHMDSVLNALREYKK